MMIRGGSCVYYFFFIVQVALKPIVCLVAQPAFSLQLNSQQFNDGILKANKNIKMWLIFLVTRYRFFPRFDLAKLSISHTKLRDRLMDPNGSLRRMFVKRYRAVFDK